MANIKIYSTPTCTYCIILKKYLESKGFDYEEVDVSKDEEAKKRMVDNTNQMTVPVTEFNNEKFIVGFKKDEIEKELENLS